MLSSYQLFPPQHCPVDAHVTVLGDSELGERLRRAEELHGLNSQRTQWRLGFAHECCTPKFDDFQLNRIILWVS